MVAMRPCASMCCLYFWPGEYRRTCTANGRACWWHVRGDQGFEPRGVDRRAAVGGGAHLYALLVDDRHVEPTGHAFLDCCNDLILVARNEHTVAAANLHACFAWNDCAAVGSCCHPVHPVNISY